MKFTSIQPSRVDFRLKVKFLQCYRTLSLHIVPYRASRKKTVVSLHQKNVDGGST